MNKRSPTFWLLVLALGCVFVWMLRPGSGGSSHDAPLKAAYSDINGGLKTALNMFSIDCGRLPTTAEGLQALITRPTNLPKQGRWQGPYWDPSNLRDPWGHEYVYRCPGLHNSNGYDLYSVGPDGIKDDSDDIGNWQLNR
jgi:general secretion pathway protein G